MKYGLDENGLFYVEYTSCSRPVGNMREELNIACKRTADQGDTIISLSSGLDSQVILHSFVEQNLNYHCAFLHWLGVNDLERDRIAVLEKKYGFKAQVVEIDPLSIQHEMEALAEATGVPVMHHITNMFFDQLDPNCQIIEGIENANIALKGKGPSRRWVQEESLHGIDIIADWFHRDRKKPLVHIDRRSPHQELAISMLTDDIARAYREAYLYIKYNGMIDSTTNERINFTRKGWEVYVKPLLLGKYWKSELVYFSKFASQQNIGYINNPKVRHNYTERSVLVDLEKLLDVMCDWGSGRQIRFMQHDFSMDPNVDKEDSHIMGGLGTQPHYAELKAITFKAKTSAIAG